MSSFDIFPLTNVKAIPSATDCITEQKQSGSTSGSIPLFIPIIIDGCLKNLKFDTSDGKQLRDFLYVDDLIYLIFKVFENKNSKGEIFNIGSGKPQSIKKIINLIRNKIKRGRPNFGKINLRNDEILKIYPNISKAKKILNWRQNISFRIGLNKTIKFYKTRFLNKK